MEKLINDRVFDIKDKKETKDSIEIKELKNICVKLQTELKKFPDYRVEHNNYVAVYNLGRIRISFDKAKRDKINNEMEKGSKDFYFSDKRTNTSVRINFDSSFDDLYSFSIRKIVNGKEDYKTYLSKGGYDDILKPNPLIKNDSMARAEVKKYINTMLNTVEEYKKTEKAKVELKNLKSEIKK